MTEHRVTEKTGVTIRLSVSVPSDWPDLLELLGRFQELIDELEQIPSVGVEHEFNIRLAPRRGCRDL